MADPLLRRLFPEKDLNQAVAVAAMCLQEEAEVRPLISDVVTALSFLSTVPDENLRPLPYPPEPKPEPEPEEENRGDDSSSDSSDSDDESRTIGALSPPKHSRKSSSSSSDGGSSPRGSNASENERIDSLQSNRDSEEGGGGDSSFKLQIEPSDNVNSTDSTLEHISSRGSHSNDEGFEARHSSSDSDGGSEHGGDEE